MLPGQWLTWSSGMHFLQVPGLFSPRTTVLQYTPRIAPMHTEAHHARTADAGFSSDIATRLLSLLRGTTNPHPGTLAVGAQHQPIHSSRRLFDRHADDQRGNPFPFRRYSHKPEVRQRPDVVIHARDA